MADGSGCPGDIKGQEEIGDGKVEEELTENDEKPESEVDVNVSEFQCMP